MYLSVFLAVYGIQHYLSIIGSVILTPLVIAPAMGASHVSSHFIFSTILAIFCFWLIYFVNTILLSDVLLA
jgi:xanthine/uracil permease